MPDYYTFPGEILQSATCQLHLQPGIVAEMCILWRSQYCRWFETSWNSLLRSGYVACIQLTHTGTYLYEPEKTLVSSWDKFTRRLEFKYHFIIIIIRKWRIRDVNIQHLSFLWNRRKGECQTLTGVDPPSTTGVSTLEGLQWNRCTILSFVDFNYNLQKS